MKGFNDVQRMLNSEDPYLEQSLRVLGLAMAYRDREGLSQKEFAAKIRVPRVKYKKMEEGELIPTLPTLYRIIHHAELFHEVKDPKVGYTEPGDGMWVWSSSSTLFNNGEYFYTKEDAIAAGEAAGEMIFYVGQVDKAPYLEPTVNTGIILDDLNDRVRDMYGEAAEDYLSDVTAAHQAELDKRMDTVLQFWMKEFGYEPNFYKVRHIQKIDTRD